MQLIQLLNNERKSEFIYTDIFISHHSRFSQFSLSNDAQLTLDVENAGGKSEISEALSVEYMCQTFGASNVVPEMDIQYWIDYKMADYIITIYGNRVGVSVTRAMGYPTANDFDENDASRLLRKKMYGLIVARNSTNDEHSFFKSILHIWCQTKRIADLLTNAYLQLEQDLRDDIIVACTITSSKFVFDNTY